jgi:hypothetical protein
MSADLLCVSESRDTLQQRAASDREVSVRTLLLTVALLFTASCAAPNDPPRPTALTLFQDAGYPTWSDGAIWYFAVGIDRAQWGGVIYRYAVIDEHAPNTVYIWSLSTPLEAS